MNPLPIATPASLADQVTRALADDHGQLRELTARLSLAPDRSALTEALEDLSHELREHFNHEEHARGFYEVLGDRTPGHRPEIARFVEEHRELLRDLGHLVWRSQERSAPTRELERAAAELTARLHDHEAREMKLLLAAA